MSARSDGRLIETARGEVFTVVSGDGPPVLLLHGFPQTHLMWRGVAPRLARAFTTVCADLPGYGASSCPAPTPDHSAHSKRAMADDLITVMRRLGFDRFAVVGHDRGGRAAYRMALDHPEVVTHLSVLDILPTAVAWDHADARLALAFWPWSMLAQPAPLPERLIAGAPDAVIEDALTQWDTPAAAFPPDVRSAYVDAISDADHIHAICEEYRAAASIDRAHDDEDRASGRRIACPVQVLWSGKGGLEKWHADAGGPLALWRDWADRVSGRSFDAGHFFPEECPDPVAEEISRFLA